MSSPPKIDYIRPTFATLHEQLNAGFTLKNPSINEGELIPGLNVGRNTADDPERVEENRQAIYRQFGLDPEWVAWGDQVHSSRVRFVTSGGVYPETDGLVTNVPGLALVIQVADCAAVLLADPKTHVVAAVHAGWRGAAGLIVENAVQKMIEKRAQPANIHAYISPCISQYNFEVGSEVAELFPDEVVNYEKYKKPHIDLKQFIYNQLTDQGIQRTNIEVDGHCTIEDEDLFYSYRREQDSSGRMLGFIQYNR